ncbi:MAG TPA: 3-oxoacyl-[acyl-carrier-protein] reductase [Planctomycetaceae bacterium]|nr:3-oxoacyl-[acyl-carrier-protein] reductase [Planctomycetaceae bacterium]
MTNLEGRTALVTGGSRGIGCAIVHALARAGARVAFVYQSNVEAAERLVSELAREQLTVTAHQADVRNKDAADEIVRALVESWERLDILVNNAGIIRDSLLATMSPEQWRDVLDTNLSSVFNFCQAVTRPMMSARYGRIVNMSSVAAEFGNKGQANYAASKGGVEGFTRCLAKELASRGITVNAVAPGFIDTDMTAAVRNAAEAEIKKAIPVRRLGRPEDVAQAVLFLAGEGASYITGQILKVDGGLTLGGF